MKGTQTVLRTATLLASAVLSLNALLAAQARPPEPYVERGICPFECCTYREWTANDTITIYGAEGSNERLFLLLPRERFTAVIGNVHLIHVGVVLIRQPVTLTDEDSFPERKLTPGDSAYVLSYRGEGWYDVWVNDTIRSVPAFWDDRREYPRPTDRPGILVQEPEDIWWVRITTPDGRAGWIRMDHAEVSGADACG